jgi:hypothetical protein
MSGDRDLCKVSIGLALVAAINTKTPLRTPRSTENSPASNLRFGSDTLREPAARRRDIPFIPKLGRERARGVPPEGPALWSPSGTGAVGTPSRPLLRNRPPVACWGLIPGGSQQHRSVADVANIPTRRKAKSRRGSLPWGQGHGCAGVHCTASRKQCRLTAPLDRSRALNSTARRCDTAIRFERSLTEQATTVPPVENASSNRCCIRISHSGPAGC